VTAPTSTETVPKDLAERLRSYVESGATASLAWRRAQLVGLLRLVKEHEADLLDALAADLGKPRLEAWAADLAPISLDLAHTRKQLRRWMRPERVAAGKAVRPGSARLLREPLGAVLVIAPWNYPVQLALMPLGAALAAGNAVVLKPSELAPATSAALARLIPQYLDQRAVAVVEGAVEESTALLEQRWDHILYTGNGRVGRVVARAAAEHLTPTTLELGGRCPVVVDRDADLKVAARRIVWGKFLNAGQTCLAPNHVFVHESVAGDLQRLVVERIVAQYGSAPALNPELTRIVSRTHYERLRSAIEGSRSQIVHGGGGDESSLRLEPTVVSNPETTSPLMTEEIFGPVLPIVAVRDVDDALARINDGDKPLALYVFAGRRTAERVIAATSSGSVCVNHTIVQAGVPDLPFGGVGESGHGRYHGKAGFETFSNLRGVVRKPTKPDPPLLYPPFTALKERILRAALR
jgi:aldehyde dehydrogenase (NAD+)